MSTFIYDEALTEKLRNWTDKTKTEIYGPNETSRMFEVIADKNGDEPIKLPIITIERDRGFEIINSTYKDTDKNTSLIRCKKIH